MIRASVTAARVEVDGDCMRLYVEAESQRASMHLSLCYNAKDWEAKGAGLFDRISKAMRAFQQFDLDPAEFAYG